MEPDQDGGMSGSAGLEAARRLATLARAFKKDRQLLEGLFPEYLRLDNGRLPEDDPRILQLTTWVEAHSPGNQAAPFQQKFELLADSVTAQMNGLEMLGSGTPPGVGGTP